MKTVNAIQTQAANTAQAVVQESKLKLSKQTIQILTSATISGLEATLTRIC